MAPLLSISQGGLPGFRRSLAATLLWLGIVVALPLAAMLAMAATAPAAAWAGLLAPRTVAAFRTSLGWAAIAALLNLPIGVLLAWVLTRYRLPGRRLLDAAIDLPFALPTAVAGIALATLLAPEGLLGAPLDRIGIRLAYGPGGIGAALLFVGLPFVVRTVQPVLAGFSRTAEEAALTLGASPAQTFNWVVWPALAPAAVQGAALAFARGIGEYGSVIFIAGNKPGLSEIVPLLIVIRLEEFATPAAAVLGAAMLGISALLLLALGVLARDRAAHA